MKPQIAQKLIALNSEFYQTFAENFSTTRQRLQVGVKKIVETLPLDTAILDLGCGNGEFAHALAQRGFNGQYWGLDFSIGLLEIARQTLTGHPNFSFMEADLGRNWAETARQTLLAPPEVVVAFATFHHLPGAKLHRKIFRQIFEILPPGGHFIHSNWQFLNSERLRHRIQPWDEIGLSQTDLEPGDYLLDWRQGGRGLRYCHFFSAAELQNLAADTGFEIIDGFYSDGEGGNLGLYQIWKKP